MRVLVSALGQRDNLGDTALRRAFFDVLRGFGPLTVFVGGQSAGYISGLGVRDDDILVRDRAEWRRALLAGAMGGMLYAHNAGESGAAGRHALRYGRLAPILLLNRLRGGTNVHVGVGIRAPGRGRIVVACVLRLMHIVQWRDQWSAQYIGVGGVAPDWALRLGDPEEGEGSGIRDVLAVSLRYDGAAPSPGLVNAIRQAARQLDLRVLVVAQIRRDEQMARKLAALVGGEHVRWDDDDMMRQEQRIRLVYRASRIVLSDRLHALAIGVTEGALPVALVSNRREKAWRTLDSAGLDVGAFDRDLVTPDDLIGAAADIERRQNALRESLGRARASIESTVLTMSKVVNQ